MNKCGSHGSSFVYRYIGFHCQDQKQQIGQGGWKIKVMFILIWRSNDRWNTLCHKIKATWVAWEFVDFWVILDPKHGTRVKLSSFWDRLSSFFFFFGVKLSSFYFLLLIEYYHYSEANKRADRSVQKINLRCECTIYREKGIRKSF